MGEEGKQQDFTFSFSYNGFYLTLEALSGDTGAQRRHDGPRNLRVAIGEKKDFSFTKESKKLEEGSLSGCRK